MSGPGPLWEAMNARPRLLGSAVRSEDVPPAPGVYAWYREGAPIYVGKADSLHRRLWRNHLGKGRSLSGSAFRRNVACHLGFGTAADIKAGRVRLDEAALTRVRDFIEQCELAWIETETPADALDLETRMKDEWRPPFTKR